MSEDFVVPSAFPEADFRAFGLAAIHFLPDILNDPDEKRAQYSWSWQAVRYRYRSCVEINEEFKNLLGGKDGWDVSGDEELIYKFERSISQFFANGLSIFDSFAFCLYYFCNALEPLGFPHVNTPRKISLTETNKALTAAFPNASITKTVEALLPDTKFQLIQDVRNVTSHRLSGRVKVRSRSLTAPDGTPISYREESWHLPGSTVELKFDGELLQHRLDDITALLTSLSSAAKQFAECEKALRIKS